MTDLPNKTLLRPSKVAKMLDVAPSTIYYWISTGQLEAVKPAGKTIRIPLSVVEERMKTELQQ